MRIMSEMCWQSLAQSPMISARRQTCETLTSIVDCFVLGNAEFSERYPK